MLRIRVQDLASPKRKWVCCHLLVLAVCSSGDRLWAGQSDEIILSNEHWSVRVSPGTLEMTAELPGGGDILLSKGSSNLGAAGSIIRNDHQAQWVLETRAINVDIALHQKDLSVRLLCEEVETFTWPILQKTESMKALIWPRWEGCYIPLDDPRWENYLIEHGEWDTLEGLSMPFWGLACGDFSLTYIATCPYNNAIRFAGADHTLRMSFTHEFTGFQPSTESGFMISLGANDSPVEPARRFRRWLIEQGKFISMEQKIKTVPKAKRLLGAAHVYLWGDGLFTRHDVPAAKWRPFCQELVLQASRSRASPGKRIKQLTPADRWKQVVELAEEQWPSKYLKTEVAHAISELLSRKDFYELQSWSETTLPDEANGLLRKNRDSLKNSELCTLNSSLLHAAFSQFMNDPEHWGDGVSTRMLKQFKQDDFDRMRLCLSGWEGIEKRPHVAVQADQMGYLFGTYDSYHSIHDPSARGTDDTWATAQFDRELFEKGPILRKDGTKRGGFRKVGFKLSPIAARPYMERRVRDNMSKIPYNYYFVDCDAYGEVYDDYSSFHRASQADDVKARVDRLSWIGETFHVVVGSEGGSSYAAGVIHVAEGMFGPVFGWGDPDLRDKDSDYYLGQYYPPDSPKVFVMQVLMKEPYQYFYYDPRFRLPLYEIVFHDSVVSTHQWANGSLKYNNMLDTVALTELLYMVPPLYHMNLDEFEKCRDVMKRHYAFFSPLHREVGFAQMTDFNWLSSDRNFQRAVFDDRVEMVVNFSPESRRYEDVDIPGRSVLAKWRESREVKTLTYTPSLTSSAKE